MPCKPVKEEREGTMEREREEKKQVKENEKEIGGERERERKGGIQSLIKYVRRSANWSTT